MKLIVVFSLVFVNLEVGLSVFLSLWFIYLTHFLGEECFFQTFSFDDLSFLMVMLTIFLTMVLMMISSTSKGKLLANTCSGMLIIFFFLIDSMLWFFILFELSLLPLLFYLVMWGRQAERFSAVMFLLLYTIISSSPLFLGIISILSSGQEYFSLLSMNNSSLTLVYSIFAFLVKTPVFLLHSWLPKAHVEAPLEGSVILAGVMLKLGVYGLVRFLSIGNLSCLLLEFLFALCLLGSCLSAIISLSSDDMKMSVAYSSVSHMNFVVVMVLTMKSVGLIGLIIVSLAHGVSSPLLFYLVTKIYDKTHSRSVLISKGVLSKLPILSLISFFLWIINLSAPPFLPFLGEVKGIMSMISVYEHSMLWVVIFIFFSSFFSMLNYGIYSHSSFKLHVKLSNSDYKFLMLVCLSVLLLLWSFLVCI